MTHSTNIYDTEIEAVAKAEAEKRGYPCPDGEADDNSGWMFVEGYRAALDAHRATVPHVITTVEELEALPERTVIDAQNGIYQRDPNAQNWGEVGGWWLIGSDLPFATSEIVLPATVLTPTPEPTVKPDREAEFKTYLSCIEEEEPEIQRLAKYDKHTLRTIFNAGFDVAVAEGRTEREVAEAAWDEAFKAGVDYMYCEREDYDGFGGAMPPPNPYRAKGATSD